MTVSPVRFHAQCVFDAAMSVPVYDGRVRKNVKIDSEQGLLYSKMKAYPGGCPTSGIAMAVYTAHHFVTGNSVEKVGFNILAVVVLADH